MIDKILLFINSNISEPLNALINRLIGATNNTGGTTTAGTVMAKLNALITNTTTNNTASTTGTLSQKITAAINNTATNNTQSSTGILSQKLSFLINSPKVVKSVQRGIASGPATIAISTVDPTKSIILFHGFSSDASDVSFHVQSLPYSYDFLNTSFKIGISGNYGNQAHKTFSWQLIEFY